jgi:hypothetical protein
VKIEEIWRERSDDAIVNAASIFSYLEPGF